MRSLICWLLVSAAGATAVHDALYMDSSKPVKERVEDLMARMTVDEKIKMTYAVHYDQKTARERLGTTGVGAIKLSTSGISCGTNWTDCVEQRNDFQKFMIENSRLGIPVTFINEGNHGGAEGGTVFPMPVATAASWNVSLFEAMSNVVAAEARATGVEVLFGPTINMWTDARFGRLQEGLSEEPTLSSHLGAAVTRGLQGGDGQKPTDYLDADRVVALGKHFVAYGAALGGLSSAAADVNNRTMHDVYLKPWRAFAKAGGRAAMASHNTVDHIPMHAHGQMIGETLRQNYGWGDGVMLSDCNDIAVLEDFRFSTGPAHSAALALQAGVDWDLMCSSDDTHHRYNYLSKALEDGLVTEDDIDRSARRVLTLKFASGVFDAPYTDPAKVADLDGPARRHLALEAALQSAVLLKNEGALPISLNGKKVALIGPSASAAAGMGAIDAMLGSYKLYGKSVPVATLDTALAAAGADVQWAKGCKGSGLPNSGAELVPEAVELAAASDVSVLVLGDVEGKTCGEWQDRDSLDLPGGQLMLLEAVANASKTTIVVLLHGRPATFGPANSVLDKVDAMFAAWRPGEEGGNALVALMQGTENPSGKLAQNWPRTVGHVGSGSSPWMQRITGKWIANNEGVTDPDGRRYDNYVSSAFDPTPLFYFGYGLSYTSFQYKTLTVVEAPGAVSLGAGYEQSPNAAVWHATVEVKNTGERRGTEVVQIYLQDPAGLPVVRFWKRLVGFARIDLEPGNIGSVSVPLLFDDVAFHGADMAFALAPGTYTVTAGGSSLDTTLSQEVTLNIKQERSSFV